MSEQPSFWKKCNTCKKPISFGSVYWVCNVSTCNRVRTGLHFCSVECWDAHLPMMRHRESWAEERRAPKDSLQSEVPSEKKVTARRASVEVPAVAAAAPSVVIRRKPTSSF